MGSVLENDFWINFIHVLNMRCIYKIDRRGGGGSTKSYTRKLPTLIYLVTKMDIWNANLFKELMERSDSGPNTPVSTINVIFK